MNIDNLTNSFKYSFLLTNCDLKLFKQNFDKVKPNIELYSVWNFSSFLYDVDPKLWCGSYILLGITSNENLVFLEYFRSFFHQIAPYDAYINQITINDFFTLKNKKYVIPIQFDENSVFKYLKSYFF